MSRLVNGVVRWMGLGWVGVIAFGIYPSSDRAAVWVQGIGYGVGCLGMAGWAWLDFSVLGGQYRRRVLPFLLGVVAVAMGAAAASNLDGGVALAIMGLVATMVAGSELDPAPALGVTVAGVLATLVSGLVFGATYATMIGFPAIVASGLLIGRNRGAYRIAAEQAAALLAQRQQLEAEQRRADLLDERTRIAREIHDVLAHSLGALGIQIQAARSVLTDSGDIERAVDLLAAAQKMASEGLTETRRAVHALRTDTLPLAEELAKAAATYGDRYHVAVSLDTDGEPRPVPPDATVALLRVAQEALVNAAKHGGGKPVSVRLSFNAAGVGLTVKNALDPAGSGTPGLSTVNGGYGLTGMRERLRMLGGTLDAGQRDDGWVVAAHVPLTTRSNREPDGES